MSFFFSKQREFPEIFESLSFYHCLSVGKSKANQGWTPLHLASYFGHCNVAKALLEVSGKLMLLYLFARCSFLFEALLGKGRGEVEGGRGGGKLRGKGRGEVEGGKGRGEVEGGRGGGKGKGRWGPSFATTWPYLSWLIPDNCHVK